MPKPVLWNPNAAANWGLLLTPAFGAFLHAANWRALGKPRRAKTNRVWGWAAVLLAAVYTVVAATGGESVAGYCQVAMFGLLVLWYFREARPQTRTVKKWYGEDYPRRGWLLPLFGAAASLIALTFVAGGGR